MKQLLVLVLGVAGAIPLFAPSGHGQDYPTKPVRIIAAATGTTNDIFARHLAQQLTERWGRQVIVENRPGAGATIAADIAAKAPPDGYTLHITQVASFAAVRLHKKLPYDPILDFAHITLYADTPLLLVAHPSLPPKNLREFIEFAKKRSGQINYASAGHGTASHLTTELLNYAAGFKLVHVPYKGGSGAAMVALISGETEFSSVVAPNALPQVKAGKVKAFAVTSRKRFAGAPEIPTAAEAGLPGFVSTAWFGMSAPARTPPDLISRLNRDIVEILRAGATREWMLAQGAEPLPTTPEEYAEFLREEIVKWTKVIEVSGARVD